MSAATDDARARYALRLTLTQRRWVHRRNETFTFVDAETVRRRMSIDFSLPPGAGLDGTALVPLLLLDKVPLRNLDIRDAEGRPISLLTTRQNADVMVRGLELLLDRRLSPEGDAALSSLLRAPTVSRAREVSRTVLAPGSLLLRELSALPAGVREQVEALVKDLACGWVALVPIPYEEGRRQVVKLAYDAALQGGGLNRYVASFGLTGRIEKFSELVVGHAASYHCEAVPPGDTYIARAELHVRRHDGSTSSCRDAHRFRPHLLMASESRGDTGTLRVVIQAHREGLLVPLWAASVLVAALLWAVQGRLAQVDAQTVGALLLVPFALAAYYVRSQENRYVTTMLRGVRLVSAVPVVAGVAVLAALAIHDLDPARAVPDAVVEIARWGARAATAAVVLLTVALLSPGIARLPRPARSRAVSPSSYDRR